MQRVIFEYISYYNDFNFAKLNLNSIQFNSIQSNWGWVALILPPTRNSKLNSISPHYLMEASPILRNYFQTSSKLLQDFLKATLRLLQDWPETHVKVIENNIRAKKDYFNTEFTSTLIKFIPFAQSWEKWWGVPRAEIQRDVRSWGVQSIKDYIFPILRSYLSFYYGLFKFRSGQVIKSL